MTADVPTLISKAAVSGEAAQHNRDFHAGLLKDLQDRLAQASRGGPERARARHVERGKLLPRDRVDTLLDPGSPFLELSPLAAEGMYDGDAPGAGLITGIGRVSGRVLIQTGARGDAISHRGRTCT